MRTNEQVEVLDVLEWLKSGLWLDVRATSEEYRMHRLIQVVVAVVACNGVVVLRFPEGADF